MKEKIYDVGIIGAGAAGLMTAICCKRAGLTTLLLDSKKEVGAKILMSGGTRCNVTNQRVDPTDFNSESIREVGHILKGFPVEKTLSFFKQLGVELISEPGGKYFPRTNSAQTVLTGLLKECYQKGVTLERGKKITSVKFKKDRFKIEGEDFSFLTQTTVLCTGGLSHPRTGSDGSGYGLAEKFGHSRLFTSAALTPLLTKDSSFKELSGITLPVKLILHTKEKKKTAFEGDFLFTHFGFSGPTSLNMSRHFKRAEGKKEIRANFLPQTNEADFRIEWLKTFQKHPKWKISRFFQTYFPDRFISLLLKKANINKEKLLNQVTKEDREKLITHLFSFPLPVTGIYGYEKAEVTAGGIPLKEVNAKTLESHHQPNLFFAGEILDVDGHIGGFNFQWAWASGALVAKAITAKFQ